MRRITGPTIPYQKGQEEESGKIQTTISQNSVDDVSNDEIDSVIAEILSSSTDDKYVANDLACSFCEAATIPKIPRTTR